MIRRGRCGDAASSGVREGRPDTGIYGTFPRLLTVSTLIHEPDNERHRKSFQIQTPADTGMN